MLSKRNIIKKAGGIIENNGSFIVVFRKKYNDTSLPKGHIEQGESFEDAAVREVLEETGLECEIINEIGTTEYLNYEGIVQVKYFAMHIKKVTNNPIDPEVDEVICGKYNEILKKLSYITDKKMFQESLKFF